MSDYKELIDLLAHPAVGRDNADVMIAAADAIEQLVKERDAAVEDLRISAGCTMCQNFENYKSCHNNCSWEWRGVEPSES